MKSLGSMVLWNRFRIDPDPWIYGSTESMDPDPWINGSRTMDPKLKQELVFLKLVNFQILKKF